MAKGKFKYEIGDTIKFSRYQAVIIHRFAERGSGFCPTYVIAVVNYEAIHPATSSTTNRFTIAEEYIEGVVSQSKMALTTLETCHRLIEEEQLDKAMPALHLLLNQTLNSILMLNKKFNMEISLTVTPGETALLVNGEPIIIDDWSV